MGLSSIVLGTRQVAVRLAGSDERTETAMRDGA